MSFLSFFYSCSGTDVENLAIFPVFEMFTNTIFSCIILMEGIIILIVTLSSVIIIMQVCYIIKAMNYFYFFLPVDPYQNGTVPIKRLYGLLSSCVSSVKIIKEVL